MERFVLKNKYVLVTGASSGIGKELSRCLAKEGAHLVLSCHPSETAQLEQWCAELERDYSVATRPFPVDLSQDKGPEELHERVKEAVPHLDVLVNNAGIIAYGEFYQVPRERHLDLIRINVQAYLILMRLFLPDMVKRGQGRILNVSSIAAFQATALQAPYGASKAFIQSLSEAVNLEVRDKGVLVCTLNPGFTDTPLIKAYPDNILATRLSVVTSPEVIARQGVEALKKGREVFIPGWNNRLLIFVLTRLLPRRWYNYLTYILVRGR